MNFRHGFKGTRFYKIWGDLKHRCNNEHSIDYANYGGRNIKVRVNYSAPASATITAIRAVMAVINK